MARWLRDIPNTRIKKFQKEISPILSGGKKGEGDPWLRQHLTNFRIEFFRQPIKLADNDDHFSLPVPIFQLQFYGHNQAFFRSKKTREIEILVALYSVYLYIHL